VSRLGVRLPSLRDVSAATQNATDKLLRGGVADLRPTPYDVIAEGAQRTVRRYHWPGEPVQPLPLLMVPPLAAPPQCFDLRRGCSLAEHFTALGYPTYLVDYGRIGFDDRELGLEHWVEDVLPQAAADVMADHGTEQVQIVGWCLGGIMALLSVADGKIPAASVAMVASPFDFAQVALMAPIRRLAGLTRGAAGTALYRLMGGAPAPLVTAGFRLSSIDKLITKPIAIGTHLNDRDFLAQIEAVDALMGNMVAYPGRTFGQLYHRFFRVNDLHDGKLELSEGNEIDLGKIDVPVLTVAGQGDVLAPKPAVHHVGDLLTGAPEVRLASAPGGHLGVLTGRAARNSTWQHLDEFLLETA